VHALQRDQLQRKLAEAQEAQRILQLQMNDVQQDIEQLQSLRREAAGSSHANVNLLLETQRYQALLHAQQTEMQNQGQLLATETQRRRDGVVEANRQVRILDKLEARQREEFLKDAQKKEVKQLDEVAARCWREGQPWQV